MGIKGIKIENLYSGAKFVYKMISYIANGNLSVIINMCI